MFLFSLLLGSGKLMTSDLPTDLFKHCYFRLTENTDDNFKVEKALFEINE